MPHGLPETDSKVIGVALAEGVKVSEKSGP